MTARTTRTKVAIVGAGPAGLTLAYLLHQLGIDATVIESRPRSYVEARVRAGVLEHGVSEMYSEIGVGERMRREGLVHHGIFLRFNGRQHRIDFESLVAKHVTVYGQQEMVKDLIAAVTAFGVPVWFETEAYEIGGLDGDRASIKYRDIDGAEFVLEADYVVGADGFHGISRKTMPADVLRVYDHVYPFSWLGVLAESPPISHELIYTNHERGFALVSMRSPTVTRLYLQCTADEDLGAWSDDRFWTELRTRLESDRGGPDVVAGTILQKGITPMRSFVAEPMRYGRMFLTGDAAHIVPPTGAKGMNLAIGDVRALAQGFERFYKRGDSYGLDHYSETVLRRIWKAERFSAYMTRALHRFSEHSAFDHRIQLAELDYVTSSRAGAQALAENYVGLPFDDLPSEPKPLAGVG